MHEIGVLHQIVTEVVRIAQENDIDRIGAIALQVGELTGIVPKFFEKFYDLVIEDKPVLLGSKLIVEIIPGEAACQRCNSKYNVVANEGCCPACRSRDKEILGGRELLIKEILVYEDE